MTAPLFLYALVSVGLLTVVAGAAALVAVLHELLRRYRP